MIDNLTQLELRSTNYVKSMIGDVLTLLSDHFKGETTVNHLRIGHFIGLLSLYERKPTTNAEISEKLGIPRATVSRIVADCINRGWVVQRPHPEDGRRKLLYVDPDHPQADEFEKEFRVLLNKFLEFYESGKIVAVDPTKDGFPRSQ